MKLSTPSGRCGPCCSVAASGSTAIQPAVAGPAKSGQVISAHSRFGSVVMQPRQARSARLLSPAYQENQSMRIASAVTGTLAGFMAAMTFVWPGVARAQTLDKVSFGTNWVAEGE